ncbi:ISNCY family transposase [Carboxydocella thermautotrophica]|uniref:Integrase core domain-containing protein n=4 Tax=Carboxydocella TaxID=178898 RepID=A0A2R4N435_CARTR|nr:ISNCY family transposase [Carboxydocella thermautotrophica]AVX19462.1 Integrase core domain-containing protein [Carboxydocella thermautotrophica]AVX20850.1 Integrase core domain-containing protein [Carboxydocella thermautotrophica]AVX21868.1 Integrase core domain-containing protein [Carboxydocella thermautotrophica]AVX29879.1 Integrase core domain-containing protein [Carboxydocella thermautotrophica]AVX32222.1 Integrase core domain-containing protein [Carboxydocella thermautotrophica]
MTQKQLNRYKVISSLIDGKLSISEAAMSLGLSERQIKRLKKGVMEQGPAFLIHKNTGRKPQHALTDELKSKIILLKQSDKYKNANFKHFMELLEVHEEIAISYSCLHTILTKAGINSPKKRRRFKPHRRRKRRPQEGLLIQMDATPFEWFGTNEKFALHGAIDDATGKIVGLYLAKNECLQGYFEVTWQIVNKHGIPASIYADRHSIFLSQNASRLTIEEQLQGKVVNDTQFGRAMKELGITLIPARSPQAKGRVERLWETLQSRLPVEFKIAGITTIDEANEFLSQYIEKFNSQFAVKALEPETAYRALDQNIDIGHILCVKQKRTIDNGGVFSFYNRHFKVIYKETNPIPPRTKIDVLISPVFGVKVQYKNTVFETIPYVKPQKTQKPKTEATERKPYIPPDTHYFKYGHNLVKRLTYEDSDRDILKMLEEIFLRKYA